MSTEIQRSLRRIVDRGWATLPQVARLAGVSYPTILQIRKRGQIKAIKVGGMYRVYEDELCRFLLEGNYVNENTIQALQEEELR